MDLQHRIIRRHGLERDVSVPASACKPAHIAELMCEAAAFLLLLAADDADLVTKLAAGFGQGVHVET